MDLDLFRGIIPFVAVAEAGSFRGAAAALGVSPAAISKAVAKLEEEVGLALIARGGRRAALTREGADFFARCRPAVAAVSGAREAVAAARREPAGELVLSIPQVTTALVAPVLAALRSRHPRLSFRLIVTDERSRLAEEAVDVAVRIGVLSESSLIARRLGGTRMLTVAAPNYLALRGAPRRLADLDDHVCMALIGPSGRPWPWLFASGPRPVTPGLITEHGPALVDAALAGLGITQAFGFMVEPLIAEGRLVALLDDEVATGPDVHAICSPGRRATPRVRAAFDAFADAFAAEPRRGASGRAV
ncbi:MAG: LysR family transcriptional regulator [Myxococcales bacterium]|nr:LysR family transcriptional regulator [Myxococcales bacterium]